MGDAACVLSVDNYFSMFNMQEITKKLYYNQLQRAHQTVRETKEINQIQMTSTKTSHKATALVFMPIKKGTSKAKSVASIEPCPTGNRTPIFLRAVPPPHHHIKTLKKDAPAMKSSHISYVLLRPSRHITTT